MQQISPDTIAGTSFAVGSSVLDQRFGSTDQFTLGVEEELMLIDPETLDLVQRIDTLMTAVQDDALD